MGLKGGITTAIESVEKVLGQKILSQRQKLARWQSRREAAEAAEEECLRQIAEMEMAIAVLKRTIGQDAGVRRHFFHQLPVAGQERRALTSLVAPDRHDCCYRVAWTLRARSRRFPN